LYGRKKKQIIKFIEEIEETIIYNKLL